MVTRRDFLNKAALTLAGWSLATSLTSADEGKTHRVRRGDTLGAIARTHGTSVTAIKSANGLKSDVIQVGQTLKIPGAKIPPATTPLAPPRDGTSATLSEVIQQTGKLRIQRGRWKYIVVHHSGIDRGNATAYHRAHLRRGMEHGLAYHFVIGNGVDSKDGQIEIGSRWLKQLHGGHVRNMTYNDHGIGICLVGNFQNHAPSARQLAALTALIDWLRTTAPLGVKPAVTVHRWVDRNHTVCPGRHFPYATLRSRYGAA